MCQCAKTLAGCNGGQQYNALSFKVLHGFSRSGGDLMACKGHSDSEYGTCHCFDLPKGRPLYSMIYEDGRCRALGNVTCNGEDSVVSAECKKKLICVNFTAKACRFAYGNEFHCEGILSGDDGGLGRLELGKQNL